MSNINHEFFYSYLNAFGNRVVYTSIIPKEMMASAVDKEGWFEWKLLKGTLNDSDYIKIEDQFKIKFPKSFIEWHKAYFFLDGDCSLIRLPYSIPTQPLNEIRKNLDWYIPQQLIPQKLYPFANEGNDGGVLIFDGRKAVTDCEFPIRIYDSEVGGNAMGVGEIIFSSFTKLLECLTHYFMELKTRTSFEIIPDFFLIDPKGAGKTGVDYWLTWVNIQKANFEEPD